MYIYVCVCVSVCMVASNITEHARGIICKLFDASVSFSTHKL